MQIHITVLNSDRSKTVGNSMANDKTEINCLEGKLLKQLYFSKFQFDIDNMKIPNEQNISRLLRMNTIT